MPEASIPAAQPATATEAPAVEAPAPARKYGRPDINVDELLGGKSLFRSDDAEPAPEAPAEGEEPEEPDAKSAKPEDAPEVKPEPKPEQASKQLAVLAKRERELRAQAEANKADRAKLDVQRKVVDEYETARKAAAANPLEAMSKLGLTFEQVQDFVINGKKPTVEQQLAIETSALKKDIEDLRKAREDEKRQTEDGYRQKVLTEWRTEKIPAALKASGEKYELTTAWGQDGADMVFNAINQHWADTMDETTGKGEVLSIEDAAAGVEEYLFLKYEAGLTTSKVRAKLSPVAPKPEAPKAASEKSGPPRAARTLTNSSAASVPPPTRTQKTAADYRADAANHITFTADE